MSGVVAGGGWAARRWVFISALGLGQICSWGSLYYAFPLIAEQVELETGWSRTALYGAATAGLVLGAVAAFPIGRAIDRGLGRIVMVGGSILAGALLIAWSRVHDIVGLYVIVGLLGAVQAATLYEAAFAVVARRVGAGEARSDITALTLWGGFASTVFVPLVQLMMTSWGWRGALVGLGVINLMLCAALYATVISARLDVAHTGHPGAKPVSQRPVRDAVASPVFWMLALAFTTHAAAFTAFTFHAYPLLLERGFSAPLVVTAMAIIGPAQVGGRIAITALARRAPIAQIGAAAVAAFPVSFIALAFLPPSFLVACIVMVLYGAANGILTIVRGAAVPEMLTRANYGSVMGVMNVPATMARALAPLGAAALWSLDRSYFPVLMAIVGGSFVLAGAFWMAAWTARRRAVEPPTRSSVGNRFG
jgi:predicted MFS family arabinose efflux permease